MDKKDTIASLDRAMKIAKDLERDIPIFERRLFLRGLFIGAALVGVAWAVFG